MPEITPNEVKQAVDQLRKTVEEFGIESSQTKEAQDRTDKAFESSEAKHSEVVQKQQEMEQKALDLEERVKDFEVEVAKHKSSVKTNYKDGAEYKALNNFCKYGEKISAEEVKALRMDNDTDGGYLTNIELDNTLIKYITEISPIRQVARTRTVGKKTFEMPVRKSLPVATYEGEAESGNDSQGGYGAETMTAYRLTTTVPMTKDLLMDSSFDVESEVTRDVAEAYAFTEGNKFILGTGVKQPEGFLANAKVIANPYTSESAGAVSGDDLLLITGQLKAGQNPMFAFNRQTLAFLRTLKNDGGAYAWQPSLVPGVPNSIAGERYVIMNDMPNIAANAYAIMYADFMRGYQIIDRTGLTVIRDNLTQKRKNIIELTFHKYNTGKVIIPEAFKVMKVHA